MSDLIVYPPGTKLNNLQRRTLARVEMAHMPASNLFHYLLNTQHARHYRAKDGVMWHCIMDQINIVYAPKKENANPDFEPRFVWRDLHKQILREDKQLGSKISRTNLPSWEGHRWYPTDVISTGWLFFLITGLHTPIANAVRGGLAENINQKEREAYAGKVQLLDKEIHGVGSEIQLMMQSIYETGDYDDPIVPLGVYEK